MKQANDNHDVRRVAIAILYYLRDHPSAKDSASGIAKWWVSEEREVVEKALALLIKEGAIEKSRNLYQLAPSQPAENGRVIIDKALRRLRRKK